MFLNIAKECLHDHLILSLFAVFLFVLFFIVFREVLFFMRDNSNLQNKQTISRLLKKTKFTDRNNEYLNLTTLEYYPYVPDDRFFFHFEINGTEVEYEVPCDLYDEAGDNNQFLFINYAVTQLSKKIKVRRVHLMHFSECLE